MGRLRFYDWLVLQQNRSTRVGDLARDCVLDTCFPRDAATAAEVRNHLITAHAAIPEARESVTRAFRSYRAYQRKEQA